MPTYIYKCQPCDEAEERMLVPYDERENQFCGTCASRLQRIPAMPACQFFEPFYAEPFDCDINGKREWEQAKKVFGVEEKGKVGGARLEETSKHAQKIGPQPMKGISLADTQRRLDREKAVRSQIDQTYSQQDGHSPIRGENG